MSTTWERFAGREDKFALRLAFRPDPDPRFVEQEVSQSWGSFQIWAGGKNLCAHSDQGETLDSVHWYLLPLIEWLVASWDALLHEERLPVTVEGATAVASLRRTVAPAAAMPDEKAAELEDEWHDWWSRHSLRSARAGGPFPDLVLRRWRDEIELSWGDSALAGAKGLEFLASSGAARIDPVDVAGPLLSIIEDAASELFRREPLSARLEELVTQARAIAEPGRARSRLAWMAGLRNVASSVRDSWQRVEEAFSTASEDARRAALGVTEEFGVIRGSCQAALLFGAVAPDVTTRDVERLAAIMVAQYAPGSESDLLAQVSSPHEVPSDEPAWQDGLELAEEFREAVGLSATEPIDLDALLRRLEVDVQRIELDDPEVRGVAIASTDHKPTIIINGASVYAQTDEATRFTLAHELCHLVVDRGLHGRRLAVASGPWAPREVEQRANAFAAYLLMPPQGLWLHTLKQRQSVRTLAGVDALATTFQVSVHALIEHLPNVGLVSDGDRERLLWEHFQR